MSEGPAETPITSETPIVDDVDGGTEGVHTEEAPEVPLVTVNLVLPNGEKLPAMIDPLMPVRDHTRTIGQFFGFLNLTSSAKNNSPRPWCQYSIRVMPSSCILSLGPG